MPRPTRHVVLSPRTSPSKLTLNDDETEKAQRRLQRSRPTAQEESTASPVRKMNKTRPRRPRDSDISEVLTSSDNESTASPYTPHAQDEGPVSKKSSKTGKQPQHHQKERLQKVVARRSLSGTQTHTPRQVPLRSEDVPSNLVVTGTALTPASKRPIPILSNFEDWLKLATDNKINATNSWNFALIDYFHEMSLLRDEGGKGINFQKASCTLDGCVKIYVGRVESVGVEAGRLLSGLASSGGDEEGKGKKKRRGEGEEGDNDGDGDSEEEGDGEEGSQKKKEKKRKNRSHEATLAPSFASLQLKKLELEFAVDALFKKASADFDEGGAKGLLLNHLCINDEGRIVFDSSDDVDDAKKAEQKRGDEEEAAEGGEMSQAQPDKTMSQPEEQQQQRLEDDIEIDLVSLGNKFFPDLSLLDELDICPSMKNFRLGDPTAELNINLLRGNEDWKDRKHSPEKQQARPQSDGGLNLADQSGLFLDGSNGLGLDFDDDDDGAFGGFDMADEEVGFGQGGEVWAKEAAMEPMLQPVSADDDEQNGDGDGDGYAVSIHHRYKEEVELEAMFALLGRAFNSRAKVGTRGFQTMLNPITNWRIAKLQEKERAETAPPTRTRKEKEPFEIDFHGEMSESLKALLKEKPVNNDKISLPKTQIKTKGRNLLDKSDELIDVKAMMRLWTKPKCRVVRRRGGISVVDEGFGARGREQPNLVGGQNNNAVDEDEDDAGAQGDYDANFFADDEPLGLPFDGPLPIDDDDDEGGEQPGFVDAREMLSQPPDGQQQPQSLDDGLVNQDQDQLPEGSQGLPFATKQSEMLPGSFGSQLITQTGKRLRPEYVNYARTAKKVDVRALKENMWKGMVPRLDVFSDPSAEPSQILTPPLTDGDGDTEMGDADEPPAPPTPTAAEDQQDGKKGEEMLRFTQILSGLKNVYPDQQMKDISTSYGFICLLHLANEKGLMLEGGREEGSMNEIMVRRDPGVGEGYVGE